MSELLHHRFAADLDVRSGGEGRTVMGICCPFDSPTPIQEWGLSYIEQFANGSFANTIADRSDRVKFLALHDRGSFPLGRAEVLREDAAGLYGEFRVSKTERGDEALELVRDGALDGFSVGFMPIRSTPEDPRNGDTVTRNEVRLSEVSAVSFPAYENARITGVRSEQTIIDTIAALEQLRESDTEGLDLSRLDTYLGWAFLLRAGKKLSASTMTDLQGVLDLVKVADSATTLAHPRLAALMGLSTDADADDTGDGDDTAGDATGDADTGSDDGRQADDADETRDEPAPAALDYDLAVRMARRHRVAV